MTDLPYSEITPSSVGFLPYWLWRFKVLRHMLGGPTIAKMHMDGVHKAFRKVVLDRHLRTFPAPPPMRK